MDESTTKALQVAHSLIKSGKPAPAADILFMLVRANPNLVDAWYLLGFALPDQQKRIDSFKQVLRIDPTHQSAQKQLAILQNSGPGGPANLNPPTTPQAVVRADRLRQAGASQSAQSAPRPAWDEPISQPFHRAPSQPPMTEPAWTPDVPVKSDPPSQPLPPRPARQEPPSQPFNGAPIQPLPFEPVRMPEPPARQEPVVQPFGDVPLSPAFTEPDWMPGRSATLNVSSQPQPQPRPAAISEPLTRPLPPAPPVVLPAEAPRPVRPAQTRKTPVKKRPVPRFIWIMGGIAVLVLLLTGAAIWWMSSSVQPGVTPTPYPQAAVPTVARAATPTPPSTETAGQYTPIFRGTACPFSIPLGTRVKCGMVDVPRDHGSPVSGLIALPVALYQSKKAGADVVFYLQGGPGAESLDWSISHYDDFVAPLLEQYDVLFFDARGTGRSEPSLACPELNAVFLDAYFQTRNQADAFSDFNLSWTHCRDAFSVTGLDPAFFTTIQSAADVNDIVHALGYERVNLLGVSYGSRLGLTVMRDTPEIVRAAVLDSPVPLQARLFNRRASDLDFALRRLFADCAANPECDREYPGLERVFNTLVARFDKKPVSVKAYDASTGFSRDVPVDGVVLMNAIAWGLRTSDLVPIVPKSIYDIQQGDYTFLSFALGISGSEFNSLSLGTYFASVCAEQVYASTPEQVDLDLNLSPSLKKYGLAGIFGSSQRVFDLCLAWGAHTFEPRDSTPVIADIPSLIFSGQYDPITPTLNGEMVASDLPDNHYYQVPGAGHAVTLGDSCALKMLMQFFADPASAPDAACLQSVAFQFFLPYDGKVAVPTEPLVDPAQLLRGVIPSGWKKDSQAVAYTRHAYLFDPTSLTYTSFPAPSSVAFASLSRSFGGSGFDDAPKFLADHTADNLKWTVYSAKYRGAPALVALAQVSRSQTLAVVLVVTEQERSAYYTGLLLPVLDAYNPN